MSRITGRSDWYGVSGKGLSHQGVRVSFWHPGPRKIPILRGKDTPSFGQKFLKISIISRYFIKKLFLNDN